MPRSSRKPSGEASAKYLRAFAAAAAATIAYFIYGFAVHGRLIAQDYTAYPSGVYRAGSDAQSHIAFALVGTFVAIFLFTIIFSKISSGVTSGAGMGLLFGIFMDGGFVGVNYGTIHMSGKLAAELALSALTGWMLVGIVVGFICSRLSGRDNQGALRR